MLENLRQFIHSLPPWLNLKVCGAIVLIGAGAWLFFKALGEVAKILIALALIGAGVFLAWKVVQQSRPEEETEERQETRIHIQQINNNLAEVVTNCDMPSRLDLGHKQPIVNLYKF